MFTGSIEAMSVNIRLRSGKICDVAATLPSLPGNIRCAASPRTSTDAWRNTDRGAFPNARLVELLSVTVQCKHYHLHNNLVSNP